jgi:excisionase family DNA binding protein
MKKLRIPLHNLGLSAMAVSRDIPGGLRPEEMDEALRRYVEARARGTSQPAEPAPHKPERLFTIAETAEWLQVCRKSVFNLLDAGSLPRVRLSKRIVRIPEAAVRALAESGLEG